VRKKLKSKAFAANVSREDIQVGADSLGLDLDGHIGFVLEAMRGIAAELGLDGARPALR
jgi:predicted hydrolase (HD superfamily)